MWEIPVPGVFLRSAPAAPGQHMGGLDGILGKFSRGRGCKALELAGGVTSPGSVRGHVDAALEDVGWW